MSQHPEASLERKFEKIERQTDARDYRDLKKQNEFIQLYLTVTLRPSSYERRNHHSKRRSTRDLMLTFDGDAIFSRWVSDLTDDQDKLTMYPERHPSSVLCDHWIFAVIILFVVLPPRIFPARVCHQRIRLFCQPAPALGCRHLAPKTLVCTLVGFPYQFSGDAEFFLLHGFSG